MLIDGKKIKIFKLEDLNSRISFSKWIKNNLENERAYSESEIFESNRYLEYVKYIEEQVSKQPLKNKTEWISAIKNLREEKEKK